MGRFCALTFPAKIPDADYVKGMYDYLRSNGECYWIEILEEDGFVPIGDITVKAENLPIVVGDSRYRGRGIGKKAMQAAIRRARELGITKLFGSEVYEYNAVSQRLHESLGFKLTEVRGGLRYYELDLRETPYAGGCV